MLRYLLGVGVGFSFSSKNDGEGPKIAMADDFAETFLGKEPGGSDPAFDHVGIAPASHVMRSLLQDALWSLNDVSGPKAFVERWGKLQPLHREHLRQAFS